MLNTWPARLGRFVVVAVPLLAIACAPPNPKPPTPPEHLPNCPAGSLPGWIGSSSGEVALQGGVTLRFPSLCAVPQGWTGKTEGGVYFEYVSKGAAEAKVLCVPAPNRPACPNGQKLCILEGTEASCDAKCPSQAVDTEAPQPQAQEVKFKSGTVFMGTPGGRPPARGPCIPNALCTDEMKEPERLLPVAAFVMDVHEVTVGDYDRCVKAHKCEPIVEGVISCQQPRGSTNPISPRTCVSWTQADTYCRWIGKRLPTEEEWEYAAQGPARGPSTAPQHNRKYPWGDVEPKNRDLCTFQELCPVGSHPDGNTPEGVSGLGELPAEWTSSPWDSSSSGRPMVVRGTSDCVSDERCAARCGVVTDVAGNPVSQPWIGFRCARAADVQ